MDCCCCGGCCCGCARLCPAADIELTCCTLLCKWAWTTVLQAVNGMCSALQSLSKAVWRCSSLLVLLNIGAVLMAGLGAGLGSPETEDWAPLVLLVVWAVCALAEFCFSWVDFQADEEHLTAELTEDGTEFQFCWAEVGTEREPRPLKLSMARGVYYMYNLFQRLTIRKDYEQVASRARACDRPPSKSRLLAQLNCRAAMHAYRYAHHQRVLSDLPASRVLSLDDLEDMARKIKAHRNTKAPFVARWHSALRVFAVAYMCFVCVLVIPCFLSDRVKDRTGWLVVGGSLVFVWCFMHSAAGDRELAMLGPRHSAWGVIILVLWSWCALCASMGLLVYTDVCEEKKRSEYEGKGISFVVIAFVMMILGMRMYVGKVIDYCELRLELIALGQGWLHAPGEDPWRSVQLYDPQNNERRTLTKLELAAFLSTYEGQYALDTEDRKRMKEAADGIRERWYIGLIVICLGGAPTVGKVVRTIWEGKQGNLANLNWEEGPALVSTTAVIVVGILTDRDLRRWMGTLDSLTWTVLATLSLGTQVSGILFGEAVATVDDGRDDAEATARAALIIAGGVFLAAQLCTAVWAALKTDLELMTKLYVVDWEFKEPVQKDGLKRRTEEPMPRYGLQRVQIQEAIPRYVLVQIQEPIQGDGIMRVAEGGENGAAAPGG